MTLPELSRPPQAGPDQPAKPRLCRPEDDRWIAGVCSGIGRRWGLSPNLVRALFVLSCLLPGPQFVFYLMLWAIIPSESKLTPR